MLLTNVSFLYIDDHPASRQVMELMLGEVMGVKHLTVFSNSEDVLVRIEELDSKFDVVFLDLHMEPQDGIAVYKMLRQHSNFQSAKFVAVTASIIPDELEKIRQTGFNGLLMKPIRYETFPNQVERILAGEDVWEGIAT